MSTTQLKHVQARPMHHLLCKSVLDWPDIAINMTFTSRKVSAIKRSNKVLGRRRNSHQSTNSCCRLAAGLLWNEFVLSIVKPNYETRDTIVWKKRYKNDSWMIKVLRNTGFQCFNRIHRNRFRAKCRELMISEFPTVFFSFFGRPDRTKCSYKVYETNVLATVRMNERHWFMVSPLVLASCLYLFVYRLYIFQSLLLV